MALGESVEEAFYTIYHIQAACQIQVTHTHTDTHPDEQLTHWRQSTATVCVWVFKTMNILQRHQSYTWAFVFSRFSFSVIQPAALCCTLVNFRSDECQRDSAEILWGRQRPVGKQICHQMKQAQSQ